MKNFLKNFVRDESGASAAEYALILAIVGTGIAVAAFNLGDSIGDAMGEAEDCIRNGADATGCL
jgi:pilus assembly protein Flp/PilA